MLKTILKKKSKTADRQNPRTNGRSKAIQTKSQIEAYTYTLTKSEKGEKKIYRCSQRPPPQFGMIRCLFRYSTDAGTSSCLWRYNLLLLRLLGEISLSLLFSHSSWGSALDLDPPLCVVSLRASALHRQDGVKEAADSGALAHLGQGEGGVRMRGEPAAAEAGVTLQQPEVRRVFSWGSCPWITGPWQWLAAQVPGRGGVDSDLCLHTGFLVAAAAALASHARLWGPC